MGRINNICYNFTVKFWVQQKIHFHNKSTLQSNGKFTMILGSGALQFEL